MSNYKQVSLSKCGTKYDVQQLVLKEFGIKIPLSKLKTVNKMIAVVRNEDGSIDILDSKNRVSVRVIEL